MTSVACPRPAPFAIVGPASHPDQLPTLGQHRVELGLGPIGDMCTRIAQQRGVENVIGVDLVPERNERARAHGVDVVDLEGGDVVAEIREKTGGRGPDAVIDAVGMEAHGAPFGKFAQTAAAFLPDAVGQKLAETAGVDRLSALNLALELVRRGGTVSLSGVYGGAADPLPMLNIFDKQIQLRMGQANVKRWVGDIMPLLEGDDVLGVDDFATHRVPLADAPRAYEMFQKKEDGAIKIVLTP